MGISIKTQMILWSRAAGRCAFPDCRRRELVMDASEADDVSVVGDVCHIVAISPAGPRGDSTLTLEQRDQYDNLILLCKVHHKLIDDQPDIYTVERLREMKAAHEEWVLETLRGSLHELERQVAASYRALGASRVEHDIALAGNQIDVYVEELTASGAVLRTAIEVKDFSKPVSASVVNSFAAIAGLLKNRGLIDKAVIVSRAGFSQSARDAANAYGIELFEIADLEQRIQGRQREFERAEREIKREHQAAWASPLQPKHIFVVMPFVSEFEDVYVLGIREVAEKMGLIVERADDVEHNQDILDLIQKKSRFVDAVIADTTGQNPNVFYEVGYSHAVKTSTILISRKGSEIPFDLQSLNHIFYETIVELREKLEKRLKATLNL